MGEEERVGGEAERTEEGNLEMENVTDLDPRVHEDRKG